MAIKGKKRTRGGRARVATAPRPKFVVPKKPLFQRTWFRLTLISVLVLAAGSVVFFAWQAQRDAAARELAQEEVARLGVQIENALTGLGQAVPGGSFIVLSELGQRLAEVQTGDVKPKRLEQEVEDWTAAIDRSQERLTSIETDRGDVRRAIERMRQGLALFAGVVTELPEVLDIEGEEELNERITDLQTRLGEASGTFESGWLIYQNERADVGLDEGAPGVETGLPPGGFPPGGGIPPGGGLPPEVG